MEVVGIDDHVPGLVRPAPRHAGHRHQRRIDGIAKTADDYQLRHRFLNASFRRQRVALASSFQRSNAFADRLHTPELISALALLRHQLAFFHWQLRQTHRLRQMLLEDESELLVLLQLPHLSADSFLQAFVRDLCDQVLDFGHTGSVAFAFSPS